MEQTKKTLYIGAHPDDVFISSAISINRYPRNSYVLTLATGVSHETYPADFFGIIFQSKEEFVKRRLKEDIDVMYALGLNTDNQYFNLQLPNERTYLCIDTIIQNIRKLIKNKGIERIVTHEFPQAHPDHEVASFCSHKVAGEKDLEIWEYPMYGYKNGKFVDMEFLTQDHTETAILPFTLDQIELRERLIRNYQSQVFIVERFRRAFEAFGRVKRDFKTMQDTLYFYRDEKGKPTPKDIRRSIREYLQTTNL